MHKHIERSFFYRLLVIAAIGFAVLRFDWLISLLTTALGALSPLLLGFFFAYAVNVFMRPLERRLFPKATFRYSSPLRRALAITIALLIIAFLIALVLLLVLPSLADALGVLLSSLGQIYADLQEWAQAHAADIPALANVLKEWTWDKVVETVAEFFKSSFSSVVSSAVSVLSSVFTIIVDIFFAVIFMVYILFNKEKLSAQLKSILNAYMKEKHVNRFYHVVKVADACFSSYVLGQCIEALILGALCTIGMWIFGFPYALMVGAFMAVTALIPIVGAYVGGALGAIMMLTESPATAVWFLVFILCLQQLEGNLIYPRVMGNSIGLPGLWVLAAITIGGSVGGLVGMLLGVPLFATFYKLLFDNVAARNKRKAMTDEAAELAEEATRAAEEASHAAEEALRAAEEAAHAAEEAVHAAEEAAMPAEQSEAKEEAPAPAGARE